MAAVPHVTELYRSPSDPPPLRLPHLPDLDAVTGYLMSDDATTARHVWFHGPLLEGLFPPLMIGGGRTMNPVPLPTRPVEVQAGVAADRSLITWRRMLQGVRITDATNLPNPRLDERAQDAMFNFSSGDLGGQPRGATVFGLLTDWAELPPLDASQPWRGHPAFRPHPDLTDNPVSDICNPLVEVFRLQAAIAANPHAKGTVHRAMREGITGWTPVALDFFNAQIDHINTAIAVIHETRNQA